MPDLSVLQQMRVAASFTLTFLLTGWILGKILVPEKQSVMTRFLLSLSLAVPATVLLGLPGFLVYRLSLSWFGAALLALCVIAVALHRHRLRELFHPKTTWLAGWRRCAACAGLLALVVGISWFGPLQVQKELLLRQGLLAGRPVQWYYVRLAKETIANMGFPATLGEWGQQRPFPTEYAVMSIHTAITARLSGTVNSVFVGEYAFVVACLILLAFFALWSRWLPRWWAFVAAALTLSLRFILGRVDSYAPEVFGLMLVLWSCWLFDVALERRSPRWGALAGLLSATAFLAHAEVWLLTAPLWIATVLGRLIPHLLARYRRHNLCQAPMLMPRSLMTLMVCGLLFMLLAVGGRAVFGGANRMVSLVTLGERGADTTVPSIGQDPTWALQAAMYNPSAVTSEPGNIRRRVFGRVFIRSPYKGLDLGTTPVRVGLALAAAIAVWSLRFSPRRCSRGAITLLSFVVSLYVLAWIMLTVYHTYVPQRATARLTAYDIVVFAPFMAYLGWLATRFLRGLASRLWCRRRAGFWLHRSVPLASTLVPTLLLLVLFAPTFKKLDLYQNPSISPSVYRAYRWIGRNLPQDTVILTNGYTEGTLGSVSGLTGWIDGRAPFLEGSSWRYEATMRLINMRSYFLSPGIKAGLLPDQVDYVLAVRPGTKLGGAYFQTSLRNLANAPNLKRVRSFGGGRVLLFKLVRTRRQAVNAVASEPPGEISFG